MAKLVDRENAWDVHVPKVVFSYNISYHKVINCSPYYALYGREPRLNSDNKLPVCDSYIDDENPEAHHNRIKAAAKEAEVNTLEAQRRAKLEFDRHHPDLHLEPGDLVAIKISRRIVGKVQKWQKKWCAPFEVLEKLGPITYKVVDRRPMHERPLHGKTVKVVSTRELKRWYNDFDKNSILFSEDSCSDDSGSESDLKAASVTTFETPVKPPSFKSKFAHNTSNLFSDSAVNSVTRNSVNSLNTLSSPGILSSDPRSSVASEKSDGDQFKTPSQNSLSSSSSSRSVPIVNNFSNCQVSISSGSQDTPQPVAHFSSNPFLVPLPPTTNPFVVENPPLQQTPPLPESDSDSAASDSVYVSRKGRKCIPPIRYPK